MGRFYADENFPLPVVEELRRLGHDVLTTREAGQASKAIPDEIVLAFACRESRTILTVNRRHFVRLHRESPDHFGIVVCTFDPDWAALAGRIDQEVQAASPLVGRLIRVNRPPG
jgi:hypothetical protein